MTLTDQQREALHPMKDGYYISFDPTGVPEVDQILSAIGWAGKAFHNTSDWNDACEWGYGPIAKDMTACDLIQAAADDAAAAIKSRKEN